MDIPTTKADVSTLVERLEGRHPIHDLDDRELAALIARVLTDGGGPTRPASHDADGLETKAADGDDDDGYDYGTKSMQEELSRRRRP